MDGIRLRIKRRAFPSHGRVRINASRLTEIGIAEGESIDLINETSEKTVTVSVIADTMVGEGEVRVSEEDLKSLGLRDGGEVLIRRTVPLKEKATKAVQDTSKRLSEEASKLGTSVKKTAGDVKTGASKTADKIGKEAGKAGKKVKDAIDETRGRGKDL